MERTTPRARQITASGEEKKEKRFMNTMTTLLEAARRQQNTHLVLVMPGLLTTCSGAVDAKRFPLQSDNWSGHGALK